MELPRAQMVQSCSRSIGAKVPFSSENGSFCNLKMLVQPLNERFMESRFRKPLEAAEAAAQVH